MSDRHSGTPSGPGNAQEQPSRFAFISDIRFAEDIVETVREPLIILDPAARVKAANRAFYRTFGVSPEETRERLLYELGNGQWDIPKLRELLEEILPKKNPFDDFEVTHEFERIGRRTMLLNARRVERDGVPEFILLAVEDITERKALEAEKDRFAAVGADLLVITGADGYFKWVSPGWRDLLGWTAEEMTARPWIEFVHPDDRAVSSSEAAQIFDGGRTERFDNRYLTKDGSYRWVRWKARSFGESGVHYGGAYDITKEKRAQAELHEDRETLETLNRLGRTLSSELDAERIIQSTTDAATELTRAGFGAFFYNVEDDRGGSYTLYTLSGAPREAFSKFPLPRATALFGPTFRGEGTVLIEDVRKDPRFSGMPEGHLPVTSYLAVSVVGRTGKVLGGLFFGHSEAGVFDGRAARIAEGIASHAAVAFENAQLYEALRRSETQFRLMADSIDQMVWVTRADGYHEYYNKRWYEFTGVSAGATDGDAWTSVLHVEDVSRTQDRWQHSLETGEPYEIEYRLRHASGEYRWALGRALPQRDDTGSITRWFGTCTDIHGRRRAMEERERLLKEAEAARAEAEAANRMKDQFLATLSHELRTPLNAIVGWSRILLTGRADADDVQEGLQAIDRNAKTQAQLIEDLLDVSRIMSGNLRLDVQRVSLVNVIEAALQAVAPAADAKDVKVRKVLDSLAGPVTGDPTRLQQIVWNLLTNAIKFTPRGGRVQVLLERVNSHVEISVIDTGLGIRPEFLPHVFDRFRQADASTTRRYGGLGLGLSIVKHLAEMHAGSVRAKSPGEGQGATFVVSLPITVVHEAPPEKARPKEDRVADLDCSTHPLSGVKILVVDDEADARAVVRRVLVDCGAEVRVASSAAEALSVLDKFRAHVLVSDVGMPDEDGYDLIRQVRAGGRSSKDMPAVALTAFARSEDRTRAMRAGFQSHVAKPVDPSELVAVVASLAGKTG